MRKYKQQIHISMNKKQLYTAPEAELLVVRFEENIMSPNGNAPGLTQDYDDWN